MMGRLRARFPDLHVIAHVGFARNQLHQRTGWPHPVPADPALLEVIDGVFSGDPQSMDIPQSSFARNIDLYQDRAVWKLHQAGYPLSRIEDHGSIMGRTNTACSRGRAGFRRSHIGQLARGGGRDFFYGDPGLLTDADVRGMKAARELFFDAFRRQLTTQFIGAGEPGLAPWHAYLTGGARRGLLYVVNPTFTAQRVTLPIVNLATARVLFHEGPQKPVAQVSPDHLVLDLGPEQMAVVGLGAYADPAHDLGDGTEFAPPAAIGLVATIIRPTPGWGLEADLPTTLPAASHVLVVARAWDGDPADPAHLLPYIFATQTNKAGETTEPKSHELLSITLTDADGQAVRPVRRVPEVAVWSGMSWVATVFPATPGGRIGITQRFEKNRRITATVYQLA